MREQSQHHRRLGTPAARARVAAAARTASVLVRYSAPPSPDRPARAPSRDRPAILCSRYPHCILVMHSKQRCTLSSARRASPAPAGPAPRHGAPRAQGASPRRVRRDVDVAEPAAGLPDRAGPRRGSDGRGHRRQPLPRLRRRHRGQLDRSRASAGRGRDQGAGRRADPLLRVGLLPADLPGDRAASWPAIAPISGRRARLPRQLRDGGRRGLDQARPLRDQAAVHRRVPRRVPRPDLWLGLA